MCTIAIVGATLEKFALEIRHLSRTEVGELEEMFSSGQKGSSAMPHKRNPIISERMCGLARLLRANAMVALENVALWHERDISHSSVERIILPDSTIILDYMLFKMTGLVQNLQVYPKNMMKNLLLLEGITFSQQLLLMLAAKGLTREEGYQIVQSLAFETKRQKKPFKETVARDSRVQSLLNSREINQIFDLDHHLKHVDFIFNRVFGSGS
jgi:adenylosuccinate lyase